MTLLQTTIEASLGVQLLTLLFNLYAFFIPVDRFDFALKEILGLETAVQIVELIFYGWYRNRLLVKQNDVTIFRYYDWFFTTPTMLVSTAGYYGYLEAKQEPKQKPFGLGSFVSQQSGWITLMILSNALMLGVGYLQELGLLSLLWSSLIGYAALVGSFAVLYRFASKVPEQQWLYQAMGFTWSLYGVAAWLPSTEKNIGYNMLDLIAKNFYGLFLGYTIHQKRV